MDLSEFSRKQYFKKINSKIKLIDNPIRKFQTEARNKETELLSEGSSS
jgi:hypothetical protein